MDYHNRFGLSPVNPDHVDLEKWPMFARLKGGMVAHLHVGDALLIPDGWWHQVLARSPPGFYALVAPRCACPPRRPSMLCAHTVSLSCRALASRSIRTNGWVVAREQRH